MHRLVLAGVVLALTMPSRPALRAQGVQSAQESSRQSPTAGAGDTAGTRAPTAFDSAGIVIRVTSRKLPFEFRDLVHARCSWLDSFAELRTYVNPASCTRRTTGTLMRVDADTVAFERNGGSITLSRRDVKRIERPGERSVAQTVLGGILGGLGGIATAGMIGIGGGYSDDGQFLATASALTLVGAAIGGYHGGKTWREWQPAPSAVRSGAP